MDDVEPVSIQKIEQTYKGMISHEGTANNTICCVLSEIYNQTNNEHIKLQCRRATSMAKNMQRKLVYYKDKK